MKTLYLNQFNTDEDGNTSGNITSDLHDVEDSTELTAAIDTIEYFG